MRIEAIACVPRLLSRIRKILHSLEKDAMQRVVLAGEYLVVDHAWRHAPPAGERHDAVFREGLDRKDGILVGDCDAAEIGQHALQSVAAPLAEGGAMFLDQVLGDQLLELGPQARVEPPNKDRL